MRIRGWERRFIQEIEYELSQPFDWVSSNCGHLMACAIRACHGQHPVLDALVGLSSQEKAEAYVKERGGLTSILDEHFRRITPIFGQQADVGIFIDANNVQVGCVILDGKAIAKVPKNKQGLRFPITSLDVVYRI